MREAAAGLGDLDTAAIRSDSVHDDRCTRAHLRRLDRGGGLEVPHRSASEAFLIRNSVRQECHHPSARHRAPRQFQPTIEMREPPREVDG
ncbi:hypothetical protein GCM10010300_41730 [Streptomyces olivaceoviridis]|nr:hypothetical protein GCM10010300_41730 [Streptomyces olivaceoviridis]